MKKSVLRRSGQKQSEALIEHCLIPLIEGATTMRATLLLGIHTGTLRSEHPKPAVLPGPIIHGYIYPCATMASATLMKAAVFAPRT